MVVRLKVGALTRILCRYPGNTRSKIRRWFHVHHLSQFDHHRRSWCTGSYGRRCYGRDSSIWSKRCLGPFDSADGRVPLLLHYRSDLRRVVGLELCLQFHDQYHVCGSLCVYPRDFPNQRPRYGQCHYCNRKQDFWNHGSDHSNLRKP